VDTITPLDPAARDLPLRRDIRRLGNLLGQVLREQGGPALFDTEEEIRNLTKDLRQAFSLEKEAAIGGKLPMAFLFRKCVLIENRP